MDEELLRHYQTVSGYDDLYNKGLWRSYRLIATGLLRDALPPVPARILDLGGGAMLSLPALALDEGRVAEWTVVDMVDRLRPCPPRVRVIVSDALEFVRRAPEAAYDAAVVFGLLTYLSPESARAIVQRLSSVLKPGGLLLLHEPNRSSRRLLKSGLEKPVDMDALLTPDSGFEQLYRRDFNIPLLRAVSSRVDRAARSFGAAPPSEGWFGRRILGLEAALGGGLDTLLLLRRRG